MNKRIVVITGGSQGIGRAACLRFARNGAIVVAIARTASDLATTRQLVSESGGECVTHACDAGVPQELQRVMESIHQKFGRIDVLVNNAGVAPRAEIDAMSPETYRSLMSINVDSVFHASRFVWPIMTAQKSGVIVNVASVAAYDPFPGFATYGATKAWVVSFTKGLAEEGRSRGIRVIGVAPGAVDTRMLRGPFPDFPAELTLSSEDVAEMLHAVTGPEFAYATGQTITVKKA